MTDQREHIRPLTGLRFLAALVVFVQHLPLIDIATRKQCRIGNVGVAFFFVLSGFILTYVYANRIDSWKSIRKFWYARWARIWPVHLVTLLVCAVCVLGVSRSFGSASEVNKFLLNIFLIQTWVPDLQWAMGFNHVSWSIATEFFFYFTFPFLILLTPKRLLGGMATIGIACFVCVVVGQFLLNGMADAELRSEMADMCFTITQVNPLFRLFEFMAGMAVGRLFLARQSRRSTERGFIDDSITELTMLCGMAAYFWIWVAVVKWSQQNASTDILSNWIAVTGSSFVFVPFVYVFATRDGIISRLLSGRTIVYLGEISFAFYMVHQLVIRGLGQYAAGFWGYGFGFCLTVTMILSLGLSAIIHEVVEMPARNGLMKLYRRDWKSGLADVRKSWLSFLDSRVATIASLAVVVTLFVVHIEAEERAEQQFASRNVAPVIESSMFDTAAIAFGDEAVLYGATVEPQKDSSLVVKLVWEKKRCQSRYRFIHTVDANEKIVSVFAEAQQRQCFLNAPLYRKFVEEIRLQPEQLKGAAKIGIGLYSQELGAARIEATVDVALSMSGCRLDLAKIEQKPLGGLAFRSANPIKSEAEDAKLLR